MRFILKLSYGCAKRLAIALNENHNKKSVYYYGFYIVFGSLVKAAILILTTWLLGALIPGLIIVTVFCSLRTQAGGFHFDTFGRCLFISLFYFIATATLSEYTYQYWNIISIGIFLVTVFAYSLYNTIKYAPKDTPTKPITDPIAIQNYKKNSIILLIIWLVICSFLVAFEKYKFVLAMIFGVIFEIFSITPTGHTFFSKIITGLNSHLFKKTLLQKEKEIT